MRTPFDEHAERANRDGFHNHRVNSHSDMISDGIVRDLRKACPVLQRDLTSATVGAWKNQPNPWGRKRNTDLIIAEPLPSAPSKVARTKEQVDHEGAAANRHARPDPLKVRLVVEHKSVMTAHRNVSARHDDLNNLYQEAARTPNVIMAGTVMVGYARRYLNVPDKIIPLYTKRTMDDHGKVTEKFEERRFEKQVLSRLRKHDQNVWTDFGYAVSYNDESDAQDTIEKFRTLPIRPTDRLKPGLDAVLLVPVNYDNVNPASVARKNPFGIDVDGDYIAMISRLASDYTSLFGKPE